MTTAKRRINSTGRKRIQRDRVDIRLHPLKPDEPLSASASLKLDGLGFPQDASVIIEAYRGSAGMRFDCGTIGKLQIPEVLHLNEVDRTGGVLFRLKIVDGDGGTGKILGSADRLRPAGNEDLEGRRSIFPIREGELGDEVWRVIVDDEGGPVLMLNYRIIGFKHRILETPLLKGIILPAAFRIVLETLAANPVPDEDDEEDWRSLWLRYLKEQFSIDEDVSSQTEDEKQKWVDNTVQTFCQKYGFIDGIRAMSEGGA